MSRARDLADYVSTGVTSAELNKLDGLTATTDELNLVDGSVSGPLSHRNIVINGAMQVAQRGGSATTNPNEYVIDRFKAQNSSSLAPSYTVEKSSDSPEGFSSSILNTCTSNTALTSNNFIHPSYRFEAQDVIHTGLWNSSSNNELTLSFYVKANYTGKHWVSFAVANSSVGQAATNHNSYTINSANTWERKSITIPAYSGQTSLPANTAIGLILAFTIVTSSDRYLTQTEGVWTTSESRTAISSSDAKNFCDTVGNTFQITGVQLELGSVATPFEHRSYGDELQRCQRYYHEFLDTNDSSEDIGIASVYRDYQLELIIRFPVEMRAVPTKTAVGGTNYFTAYGNLSNDSFNNFSNTGNLSKKGTLVFTSSSDNFSGTQGQARRVRKNNSGASIAFDAEL